MENNNTKQIVGAIVLAGAMIAGAVLIRGGGTPGPAKIIPISKQVGLNVKKFNACLESGKFKDKVQADIDDGIKAGVNGTPSSFIVKNGAVVGMIGGAQPFEKVMEQISDAQKNEKESLNLEIKPLSQEDHIVGDINARIIIVEYSDLECPFCKVFHTTMHRVVKDSGGDVAWVYRHYPILQLHPKAFREAEATECAWEQGGNDAFWKYTDKVFEVTPSNNGLEESLL
ncbi:thioredoxin domain-containing protein [Candidatus Nomurabacteria bacterium]|nr:thioredoxin domain-containing protein [Candidatus Nomurabacteria bacterium]